MKFSLTTRLCILMHCFLATQATFGEIIRDLDLAAIFTTIDHTQTHHGCHALRSLLAQPITDKSTLEGRQAIIAHCAHNTKLNSQLDALLKAFTAFEPSIERIMQPTSDIEAAALADFYFSSNYFSEWNYSPACLELGYIAHLGNLCSSMMQHALAFAIFTWGLDEPHICPSHPAATDTTPKKITTNNHKEFHHTDKAHDDHKHHEHHDHHDCSSCAGHHHDHDHEHHDHSPKSHCDHHSHTPGTQTAFKTFIQSPQFKSAFKLWHGIAQIQELYGVQAIVRADMHCIKQLQVQLMGVARGIHLINHIHNTLAAYPECTAHLIHFKNLAKICNKRKNSEKLNELLTLLQTSTFKGEASVLSRLGIILAAHKLAQEIGHELQPALDAIGEIDAYMSCAQLFNKHQSSPLKYSFAQYTDDASTPSLQAHNFWHPLMATDAIQLNSLSLGNDHTVRNIVLTGPNACGKSSNVKVLTLCAYLAQTITLVPAETHSQTLYKEIYSSMVVSDNIQKSRSLFATELTDAHDLLSRVENLAPGEYMFIALDELFKSTHPEKGQQVAQRLLEHLHASPQVITIVSTHFENLIKLAETSNGICANYTVDNFILKPGIGSPDSSFDIIANTDPASRLLQ